jgi:hypothetical protein
VNSFPFLTSIIKELDAFQKILALFFDILFRKVMQSYGD